MKGINTPTPGIASVSRTGVVQAILILLVGLGPISFQIFLPAVPEITRYFQATPAIANLTVSLSLLSFAIASLVYGRLADRYGRRTLVFFGLPVLILGSSLCMVGTSIEVVILGRLIQPIGGAAGGMMARIMVLELFDKDEAGRVMAKLSASLMVAPLLGMPLGGFLTEYFGWRSNFVFISSVAFGCSLLAVFLLPESRIPRESASKWQPQSKDPLFKDYLSLLKSQVFLGNTLQFAFAQSALLILLSGAPFVFVETFGLAPTKVSLALLSISASAVGGSLFASTLSKDITLMQRMLWGSFFGTLGGLASFALSLASLWGLPALLISALVFSFSQGVSTPAAQTGSIAAIPSLSGTAAGFGVFLATVFAGLATQVMAFFNNGTPWVLALIFGALTLCSFLAALSVSVLKSED